MSEKFRPVFPGRSRSSAIPRSKFQSPPAARRLPPAARSPANLAAPPRYFLLPVVFCGWLTSRLWWNITKASASLCNPYSQRSLYLNTLGYTATVLFSWWPGLSRTIEWPAMLGSVRSQRPGVFSALPAGARRKRQGRWSLCCRSMRRKKRREKNVGLWHAKADVKGCEGESKGEGERTSAASHLFSSPTTSATTALAVKVSM